jgi:hypothetical protein
LVDFCDELIGTSLSFVKRNFEEKNFEEKNFEEKNLPSIHEALANIE